jgi:hypothetical protein
MLGRTRTELAGKHLGDYNIEIDEIAQAITVNENGERPKAVTGFLVDQSGQERTPIAFTITTFDDCLQEERSCLQVILDKLKRGIDEGTRHIGIDHIRQVGNAEHFLK